MASAALIDDRLQIDGFDAYTWSDTFGVPSNGGFYEGPDGTYTVQRDETPVNYGDPNPDASTDHFLPRHLNRSGPMFLNEVAPSPAPFIGYPARKFEYPDLSVTWERPAMKWSWGGHVNRGQDLLILLVILLILIFMWRKKF
jgi:hypothetical protein